MNGTAPDSQARRAVVIASQTHGLRGCHNDADLMTSLLADKGFEVQSLREQAATRAGILDALEGLIQASQPRDAAVIYYTGHGSRAFTWQPGLPQELRFILPTDIDETGADDFRGILAEELSLLQWRLTMRTPNVTTILDCCYASGTARLHDADAPRPRAWGGAWPVRAVNRRWAELDENHRRLRQEHPTTGWNDSNPLAVRMVACASHQLAYEAYSHEHGGVHGYFTTALEAALRSDADATWESLCHQIQHRVLALNPNQRPEAEGPIIRIAFTTIAPRALLAKGPGHSGSGHPVSVGSGHPVRVDRATGLAWLDGAHVHGIVPGDEFILIAPEADDAPGRTSARVTGLSRSAALLEIQDGRPVADGTRAYEVRTARPDQTIRLIADSEVASQTAAAALDDVPGISVRTDPAARGEIATVTVKDGRYMLADAAGRPFYSAPRALDRIGLRSLQQDLLHLANALRLLALQPVPGFDDLRADVDLIVAKGGAPIAEDDVLHVGDRLKIIVRGGPTNRHPVYANVIDVGVAARITILNTSEPSGIVLMPGMQRSLGWRPDGSDLGLPLTWPKGLPTDAPRFETLIAVFSDTPQDLRSLAHEGIAERGANDVPGGLARLFRSGLRDVARMSAAARFAILRTTFVLCPGGDPCTHHGFGGSGRGAPGG